MKIKLRKIVDAGTPQGYWHEIVLEHTGEEFINHPCFGRVRIASCEETETHCGFGKGCFPVSTTRATQEPMLVRAALLKRAGWELCKESI